MSLSLDIGSVLAGSAGLAQGQLALRAQVQWARILDKPTDVELRRGDVFLSPQTVRIEADDWAIGDASDDSGMSVGRRATIFGVRGHPIHDDTDIDAFDSFVMDEQMYIVTSVNRHMHGAIQAQCEAVG